MKPLVGREVARLFREQHGVASRRQLRQAGVSDAFERARVRTGEWDRPSPKVVRLAGSPLTPQQRLMIALIEGGPTAVASHQSAAWLWGLGEVPKTHHVTVAASARAGSGADRVHRLRGQPPEPVVRAGFQVTNPLRTLVDLAGVVPPDVLDTAVDRAIATRLVSVAGLEAEVTRLSRKGRRGTGAMRRALARRGLHEGPHPSVLEARLHRLLDSVGIRPIGTEVVAGPDGEYRLDVMLSETVALEVDGHVYHSTPEQKRYDEQRRTKLRLSGIFVLVYTWRDVTRDGRRVAAECRQALARDRSGRLAN